MLDCLVTQASSPNPVRTVNVSFYCSDDLVCERNIGDIMVDTLRLRLTQFVVAECTSTWKLNIVDMGSSESLALVYGPNFSYIRRSWLIFRHPRSEYGLSGSVYNIEHSDTMPKNITPVVRLDTLASA